MALKTQSERAALTWLEGKGLDVDLTKKTAYLPDSTLHVLQRAGQIHPLLQNAALLRLVIQITIPYPNQLSAQPETTTFATH